MLNCQRVGPLDCYLVIDPKVFVKSFNRDEGFLISNELFHNLLTKQTMVMCFIDLYCRSICGVIFGHVKMYNELYRCQNTYFWASPIDTFLATSVRRRTHLDDLFTA